MATAQEYLIQYLGSDGRWWDAGSDRSSAWAQHYMRQYQKQHPRTAFRVLENPSRRIVVLHDPLTDDERATEAA